MTQNIYDQHKAAFAQGVEDAKSAMREALGLES